MAMEKDLNFFRLQFKRKCYEILVRTRCIVKGAKRVKNWFLSFLVGKIVATTR